MMKLEKTENYKKGDVVVYNGKRLSFTHPNGEGKKLTLEHCYHKETVGYWWAVRESDVGFREDQFELWKPKPPYNIILLPIS